MVFLVLVNLLSIFVCYYLAKRRGGSAAFWAGIAALIGPLAIPLVFLEKRGKKVRNKSKD